MKICMLTTSFPRFNDDFYGIFIYQLARQITQEKVEVKIITPHFPGIPLRENIEGIEIYRFRYMFPESWQILAYRGGIPGLIKKSILAQIELPLFYLMFLVKSLKVGKDCDLLHVHWSPSALVALLVKKFYSHPVVLTVHGSDIDLISESKIFKKINLYILKRVDKIIAVSHILKEKIYRLGVEGSKISVIPNGVECTDFNCPAKEKWESKLVWVGRLTPEKGLTHLIRCLAELKSKFPGLTLTLVGEGYLRTEIERLVANLNLKDRVVFTGAQPHSRISAYLKSADIFVFPSLREGFGLVVLEAMACGLPVLATKVGVISEIIKNEETGFLVNPGDYEELRDTLDRMLNNIDWCRKVGVRAREVIKQQYNWTEIAKRTIGIYEQILVQ